MNIPVYIFSYNRGLFLQNCVNSILRHAPDSSITIIDDGSQDPETVRILESFPEEIRVLRQERNNVAKLGGLYHNMQIAVDDSKDDELVMFLQDDTQIVRDLREEDYQHISDYFAHFPDAAFLNPHFLKGVRRKGILKAISLDTSFDTYLYDFSERLKDRSVTMYYTDIAIVHMQRLKDKGYRYEGNESTCGVQARQHFSKMGTMVHPFVMSLPEVPIYRGKEKTWGVAKAEERLGLEPNAFKIWTDGEEKTFLSRDLSVLPFAEDFLTCERAVQKIPFVKESVNAFPFLRLMHKLELKLRKTFKIS